MMIRFKQLVRSAKCVVLSALAATALGSTAYALTDLTRPETNTTVTALIEGSATHPTADGAPKNLFDDKWAVGSGGDDSRWMGKFASDTTTYFTYGFKTATVVNAVRLRVPAWNCGKRAPKEWTIYGSFDNSGWTPIHEQTDANGNWAAQESRIYLFENSVAYKYYKIVVNKIHESSEGYAQLNEVEFYHLIRWTGAAEDGVLANPENWEGNQVPGADADVCFAGDAVPNIPADASFDVASVYAQDVTLAGDCDWSGLTAPVDGKSKIDLKGHNLTVSQLSGTCTITDSSAADSGGELHVNVAKDETVTGGATLTGTVTLVKDGEGTFKWNGGANSVATTCPVVITNGVFGFATDADNVFGNSGRITIAGKGQMDISKKSKNGGGYASYSPVLNRTLYIEGNGPDGKGAIVRNVSGGDYGYHLKVVNLTGDATIGGKSRIDFRGNCRLYGHGFTLTVKNTAMLSFCYGNSGIEGLAALVLSDGGRYEPCQNASGPFEMSGGIVLNGGVLGPWATSPSGTYAISNPVTVGEGGGTITSDQGTISFTGDVTVQPDCTATVSKSIKFANVEVGEGATLSSADATAKTITGTLSGGGTVSGANIAFSGTATRWTMAADAEGWTSKADLTGASTTALAALKAIDITYAGITSKTIEISPVLGLTEATLPLLTVKTPDGRTIKQASLVIKDGKLYLRINLGLMLIFQ